MSKLLARTKELLELRMRDKGTNELMEIAKATELPYSWLMSMRYRDDIRSPGVERVEQLYEYLSGQTLEVK